MQARRNGEVVRLVRRIGIGDVAIGQVAAGLSGADLLAVDENHDGLRLGLVPIPLRGQVGEVVNARIEIDLLADAAAVFDERDLRARRGVVVARGEGAAVVADAGDARILPRRAAWGDLVCGGARAGAAKLPSLMPFRGKAESSCRLSSDSTRSRRKACPVGGFRPLQVLKTRVNCRKIECNI